MMLYFTKNTKAREINRVEKSLLALCIISKLFKKAIFLQKNEK